MAIVCRDGRGHAHRRGNGDDSADGERGPQAALQIEVVRAHKKAIEETNLTAQDLATRIGMDRSTLANNLRVLNLPDFVWSMLRAATSSSTWPARSSSSRTPPTLTSRTCGKLSGGSSTWKGTAEEFPTGAEATSGN